MSAATDCPVCPSCGLPCGTKRMDHVRNRRGFLACAACGHDWRATIAERAQALRADTAWERMQTRDDGRALAKLRARQSRAAARDAFERAGKPVPEWAKEPT
jgi:hypothetical protein